MWHVYSVSVAADSLWCSEWFSGSAEGAHPGSVLEPCSDCASDWAIESFCISCRDITVCVVSCDDSGSSYVDSACVVSEVVLVVLEVSEASVIRWGAIGDADKEVVESVETIGEELSSVCTLAVSWITRLSSARVVGRTVGTCTDSYMYLPALDGMDMFVESAWVVVWVESDVTVSIDYDMPVGSGEVWDVGAVVGAVASVGAEALVECGGVLAYSSGHGRDFGYVVSCDESVCTWVG